MRYFTLIIGLLASASLSAQYACSDYKKSANAAIPNLDHSALSDTFDIIHTHLNLDFRDVSNRQLAATATLDVMKRQNTSKFRIELASSYSISSASINGSPAPVGIDVNGFRTIDISPGTWAIGDTAAIRISYSGNPPSDPSGWGGWHQSSPYFFNLGVGFGVNPHSYGRSLFPTFDNFIEHSTFEFDIQTLSPRKAFANGVRTQLQISGDTISQTWSCSDPMSAYLVSIAISNYSEINGSIMSSAGSSIPTLLLARPTDTTQVKSSFRNLDDITASFEYWFGPYVWDKIGYAMTTVGAMEHATSIHLPVNLADGSLAGEDIIAHELAHHWWGNLITCAKAEDMWINEGMAEFSSHLYEEDVYDRARYMRTVRGNQLQVLNYAHAQDGGYLALNGVDHGTTYGMHVYNKGAWVGHNLRGYLGDSTFRTVMANLFIDSAHTNLTTAQFEAVLSAYSGQSMSDFFSDWVYQAGQVACSIDSLQFSPDGSVWDVEVGVSQNRRMRADFLKDAPLEIRLHGPQGEMASYPIQLQSPHGVFTFQDVPFSPQFATVNEGESYLAGTTFNRLKGIQSGIYNADEVKARLTVTNSTDSHFVYLAHHWAGPESKSDLARVSSSRFWTLQGSWGSDFDAEIRIYYDGRPSSGALDADLVGITEDSLVVLYRPDARFDWQLYPDFTVNTMGASNNQFGYVTLFNLLRGDYVFANAADDIGWEEHEQSLNRLHVYPNPTSDKLTIEHFAAENDSVQLELIDTSGRIVAQQDWKRDRGINRTDLELGSLGNGQYVLRCGSQSAIVTLTR